MVRDYHTIPRPLGQLLLEVHRAGTVPRNEGVSAFSGFMHLTHEEAMAIRWHRGFSDNEFKAGGTEVGNAFEKYPLAVLTHVADLQATYWDEAEGVGKGQ